MSDYFKNADSSLPSPVEGGKAKGEDAAIQLPPRKADHHAKIPHGTMELERVGEASGFVSRQPNSPRRRPGPKRTEPQGKITLTGPQRVLDRLQAYCDAMGGVAYWQGLEQLLDKAKD